MLPPSNEFVSVQLSRIDTISHMPALRPKSTSLAPHYASRELIVEPIKDVLPLNKERAPS